MSASYLSPLSLVLIERSALKLQADARALKSQAMEHSDGSIRHVLNRQALLLQGRAMALLEIAGGLE